MQRVERLVVRHDQMGVARDLQRAAVDTLRLEGVHLLQQYTRVDHHPIADDRRDVVVEDPTGHELEGERLAVDHEGVARVVAALVADDHLHLLGDEVGELPLTFVTPLSTDDNGRGHGALLSRNGVTGRG